MKCDYDKYGGTWQLDMPANEPFVNAIAEGATTEEKEQIRQKLADSYLLLSFTEGDFVMSWQTGQRKTIYRPFPSGLFGVSYYGKTDCTIADGELALSFNNEDYFVMTFVEADMPISLERVKK